MTLTNFGTISSQIRKHLRAPARCSCTSAWRWIICAHFFDFFGVGQFFQADHLHVAAWREIAGLIQHVGDAAAHARGEIAAGLAEHDHAPAGHVFATMVADGFHDGVHAAVADAETFARHAADVNLAGRRAVKRHVADDDVFLGDECGTLRRINNDFAAAQAFAEIIVGVAFEFEGHARGHERAEALAGAAVEISVGSCPPADPFGPCFFVTSLPTMVPTTRFDVADRQVGMDLSPRSMAGSQMLEQLRDVERFLEAMVLAIWR